MYKLSLDEFMVNPAAAMLLNLAVYEMLVYDSYSANRYVPRAKDLLQTLAIQSPALGAAARVFYEATTLMQQLEQAAVIAAQIINAQGFFEWESAPEQV